MSDATKAAVPGVQAGLRLLGLGIFALAVILLAVSLFHKIDLSEQALKLLMIGIGGIVLAELLPKLQSIKIGPGGVDIGLKDLSESLTDQLLQLSDRVARLELGETADPSPAAQGLKADSEWVEAPAELTAPGRFKNDTRKGRFGGKAERKGLEVEADFPRHTDRWAEIRLSVHATKKDADVSDIKAVEFFLDSTFDAPRVKAAMINGEAQLTLTAWGGFTVGVWIPAREIALELDLAELPNAPRAIRER